MELSHIQNAVLCFRQYFDDEPMMNAGLTAAALLILLIRLIRDGQWF
jgi:hypothetical protein